MKYASSNMSLWTSFTTTTLFVQPFIIKFTCLYIFYLYYLQWCMVYAEHNL
jgi:hypothetical protein